MARIGLTAKISLYLFSWRELASRREYHIFPAQVLLYARTTFNRSTRILRHNSPLKYHIDMIMMMMMVMGRGPGRAPSRYAHVYVWAMYVCKCMYVVGMPR